MARIAETAHEKWYSKNFGWLFANSHKYSAEEERAHDEWVASFDIENWYPKIEALTFPTRFLTLNPNLCKLLIDFCVTCEDAVASDDCEIDEVWLEGVMGAEVRELAELLTAEMCSLRSARCFVKLSSRSPKDSFSARSVALWKERLLDNEAAITKLCARAESGELKLRSLPNEMVSSLLQCQIDAMRLPTTTSKSSELRPALTVLLALLRSSRCKEDLEIFVRNFEGAPDHARVRQSVVLREWVDISFGAEYRAFVCDNQLTAVSQYNHLCLIPALKETAKRERTARALCDYWLEQCAPLLDGVFEHNNYIIDFVVLSEGGSDDDEAKPDSKDTNGWRLKVIELNPFETDTDALLFRWRTEAPLLCGVEFPQELPASMTGAATTVVEPGRPRVSDNLQFKFRKFEFAESDARILLPPFRTQFERSLPVLRARLKSAAANPVGDEKKPISLAQLMKGSAS